MRYYAGIDVSNEQCCVCVVDAEGAVVCEETLASEPEALVTWFAGLGFAVSRIGLEAGPLSQWLYAGLTAADLPAQLLETRHVRTALKTMPVKTDRKDARGIAQLMRLGWFRPVHCKSLPAQQVRALLTARRLLQVKLHDVEMHLRGILRGFGLKVGKLSRRRFAARVMELSAGQAALTVLCRSLLAARQVLLREFQTLDKLMQRLARQHAAARLLMTVPGVGPVIALSFAAAIDDPARFGSSKQVGAHFGLSPKRYQSGETDITGRISKIGDQSVRTALYQAAHIILSKPLTGAPRLKRWGAKLAARAGKQKAKVALARKLAVVMHRMLADGTPFIGETR